MLTQIQKNELNILKEETNNCIKCNLSNTRKHVVFGEGNTNADLMLIGEGPGKKEDLIGKPFVGPSGKLLTTMLETELKILRSSIYITSIVKCRPTNKLQINKDRPPNLIEKAACTPILFRQIELIKPKIIVTLGSSATKIFINTKESLSKIHGKWFNYNDIFVMPLFHPSYILRNGGVNSKLKVVWCEAMKIVLLKLKED